MTSKMLAAWRTCGLFVVCLMLTPHLNSAFSPQSVMNNCSICRYAIIHRLFDACFIHFCYNEARAANHVGHSLMKRSSPFDWMTAKEARAVKRNLSSDWWLPLGLLFWANPPEGKVKTYK